MVFKAAVHGFRGGAEIAVELNTFETWEGKVMFLHVKPQSALCAAALAAVVLLCGGASAAATDEAAVAQAPAQQLDRLAVPDGQPVRLTVTRAGARPAHLFPTINQAAKIAASPFADTGPLVYHAGGSIMQSVTLYTIFWAPPKLQTGAAAAMNQTYINYQNELVQNYGGHGIDNNSTQYYQTIGSTTTYIKNSLTYGGTYTDTTAYPASGCNDSYTPGNCVSDAQIQAEIKKVMALKSWTGGLSKMFLIFTSGGEGSCYASGQCAYEQYCAYHSATSDATPVIYGNEPYGNTSVCQVSGEPSPRNAPVSDAASSTASHEITEAITDPLLNAWYTASGNEIGDLCAYDYGTPTWDSGKANEMWNGKFFLLQMEFDNHAGGCVQVGP